MPDAKLLFEKYYDELLQSAQDSNISLAISKAATIWREKKANVLQRFPDTADLAKEVRRLKEDCIDKLDELVNQASETLKGNGAQVYLAESADDALAIVGRIIGAGKTVLAAKTITGEEIGLRHHVESLGNEFWETDVGEFIQQLRKEKPMHYGLPSVHVTKEEVARLLTDFFGREIFPEVPSQVRAIREFLRSKYSKADIGISGCNVLAADTGSVFLIENEGNIRMLTNMPPVHIILVGIEKVVPTLHDALRVAEVAWRYAGFTVPSYVSMVSAPSSTADVEFNSVRGVSGPMELHVIFLDGGRSTLAKNPTQKEALYCIKCGNCLFECPVFQLAAGYYGGRGHFGGIGAIWVAYVTGSLEEAVPIAYTCLRCGRCTEVCPVSIDIGRLISELRHTIVATAESIPPSTP